MCNHDMAGSLNLRYRSSISCMHSGGSSLSKALMFSCRHKLALMRHCRQEKDSWTGQSTASWEASACTEPRRNGCVLRPSSTCHATPLAACYTRIRLKTITHNEANCSQNIEQAIKWQHDASQAQGNTDIARPGKWYACEFFSHSRPQQQHQKMA